ncbi:hypothetical protein CBM2629_B10155 [Cupriavidus taiwanensis]|nr:hypothetical protein CBM2629_B10155 [Cupriavidus taiwanensis]
MVSGIRMLEQAAAPYCQQLSQKEDIEPACPLAALSWADVWPSAAGSRCSEDCIVAMLRGAAVRLPGFRTLGFTTT